MQLNELIKKSGIRKILKEVFFLIAIGAVFVMVPQRCGVSPENLHADKDKPQRTGEITRRDQDDRQGFSLWLRDLERGQGPGE